MNPLLLGSILGGIEGIGSSNSERAANRANAAKSVAALRFSPWTNVDVGSELGKSFQSRDPFNAMLQGAGVGLKTGEMVQNLTADSDFRKKLSNALNNKELTPEVVEYEKPVASKEIAKEAVKTPYGELYKSVMGYEPSGEDDMRNRLKGQAVRDMPYGRGVGNV